MIIKKDAAGRYFTVEDPEISVSFNLPGYITLFAPPYYQLFKNTKKITYRALKSSYPTPQSLYKDAGCYAEGVINKNRFLKTINNPDFLKRHQLTANDNRILAGFIEKLDCSYKAARERLFVQGYGHIADDIDFSDPTPELEASCKIFWEFIQHLN